MSDLLHSVSQMRKSLKKKRQLRSKDLSLNFAPLGSFDLDRSKTEKNLRLRYNNTEKSAMSEVGITSPVPVRRFDFRESLMSPSRLRSYKIDATNLLVSRVNRYLNKHFLIWKKNMEVLRHEENDIFQKKAWRLKVSVGKAVNKEREIVTNRVMAGKIVRNSQDNIAKLLENATYQLEIDSDKEIQTIGINKGTIRQPHSGTASRFSYSPRAKEALKLKKIQNPSLHSGKGSGSFLYTQGLSQTDNKIKQEEQQIIEKFKKKKIKRNYDYINPEELEIYESVKKTKNYEEIEKNDDANTSEEEESKDSKEHPHERSSVKENFEGCIKNIQNFINEKREKRNKVLNGKVAAKIFLNEVEKLEAIINKKQLEISFLRIYKNSESKGKLLAEVLEQNLGIAKRRHLKYAFEAIQVIPEFKITVQKALVNMLRQLRKDIKYRLSMSFKHWKLSVHHKIKRQEEFSLSAVSIHNILLSIINCRTNLLFSTYKLALIKHTQISEVKRRHIAKGINRLNLCIRDFTLKPFMTWKYAVSSYLSQVAPMKKCINRMKRNISALIVNAIRPHFYAILCFIKENHAELKESILPVSENFQGNSEFFMQKPMKAKQPESISFHFKGLWTGFGHSNKRFSFKYLCFSLERLVSNFVYHHNSLKKNTMIKWEAFCVGVKNVAEIKMKYKCELNRAISCNLLVKNFDMIIESMIRFSFIKLIKY